MSTEKEYVQFVVSIGEVMAQVLKAVREGEDKLKFVAYENDRHKENPQAPHYKSGTVAVWKGKYTPKEDQQ